MSTTAAPVPLPRVAAVLVVHDGEEWLPSVLGTLAGQTYPALELVAVDNGSRDGSAELLAKRIPAERLLTLPADVGFGRAVAAALQHEAVAAADLLLLLHDDLVLAPDAITRLVLALRQDSELAIAGPKLREWSDDDVLQEVGMTIDRFGRAENRLEPGELDQGQHDRQLEVLYVSTAGMMIRLEALRTLGGFDARFPAFREDLDLCWRAWLSGRRVAVVPAAVGYHIAAGSRLARPFGKGRPWEARYLAERHTVAAMLKNYSAANLAWILPLLLLLAIGKVGGFLVTRRFGDAIAVARAYAWNLVQFGRTLRRRRIVQSRREAGDGQLSHLFAPGLPRARAYAEVLGSWLAGGSTRALLDDTDTDEEEQDEARALVRLLRRHPVALPAMVLLAVYLLGLARLFADGQIVGGDIAPWPSSAREFLRSYASPWNGEPVGSGAFASPVQVVLGFASLAGMGSAWLAQRVVVFGLLPLAWALALRAGRLVTASVWPRMLGATLYALSPVLLGALAQGRLGVLLFGALLPGLVLLAARAADPATPTATAWRSAALLSLGLVAGVAAAPVVAVPVVAGYAALLLFAVRRAGWLGGARAGGEEAAGGEFRQPAMCLGMAGLAALALLSPWLVGLLREGGGMHRITDNPALPLWRALGTVPEVVPGLSGPAGGLLAAATVALVVAAAILGLAARPLAVTGLVAALATSGLAAWGATRVNADWVWAPGLLLPAALALSGLAVVAAHYLGGGLRQHAFGGRQVAVLVAAGMLVLGLAGGVTRLASGPWDGLALDPEIVPAFVSAERAGLGPYRVLLVEARDGAVWWDVVAAEGPDMVRFGTTPSRRMLDAIGEAVAAAAGGADLRAGARLGLLNVRYLVLQGERPDQALVEALTRQPALEPLPSGGGRVFRVDTWLPRAAVLPPDRAAALRQTGDPGVGPAATASAPADLAATGPADLAATGPAGLAATGPAGPAATGPAATGPATALTRLAPGRYRADRPAEGLLVVSEAASPIWRAATEAGRLDRVAVDPVNAFVVPAGAQVLVARAAGGTAHGAVAVVQALLLLGVLSLALRPPGFTQARVERKLARELPSGLARTVVTPLSLEELDRADAGEQPDDDDDEPIDFDGVDGAGSAATGDVESQPVEVVSVRDGASRSAVMPGAAAPSSGAPDDWPDRDEFTDAGEVEAADEGDGEERGLAGHDGVHDDTDDEFGAEGAGHGQDDDTDDEVEVWLADDDADEPEDGR